MEVSMRDTKIEWCDSTINPVRGCSPVSEACDHCYAARMASRGLSPAYEGLAKGGRWNGAVRLNPGDLEKPRRWKRPSRIFLCSMGDVFHSEVPDSYIYQIMAMMADTFRHTYMLLTKRPDRMAAFFAGCDVPENLWVGTTVESQRVAHARVHALLRVPASVRFVSCEPLLGPLDLSRWLWVAWKCSYCGGMFAGPYMKTCPDCRREGGWCGSHELNPRPAAGLFPAQRGRGLHWIIAGTESGPHARTTNIEWLRSLRDQCISTDTPFFFKHWQHDVSEDQRQLLDGKKHRAVPYGELT
jgi:protein gp37